MIKVVACGGFDPVHVGHIDYLKKAKALGDRLIVVLNNDNWLKKKKGFVFMQQNERKKILEAIRYVDEVIISAHKPNTKDISINNELRKIRPSILAKGGDRTRDNIPETELCAKLGIKIVDGLGKKIQSSTDLVAAMKGDEKAKYNYET